MVGYEVEVGMSDERCRIRDRYDGFTIICERDTLFNANKELKSKLSSFEEVGIDYCFTHGGTRNEDDSGEYCDWSYRDEENGDCELTPLYFRRSDDGG